MTVKVKYRTSRRLKNYSEQLYYGHQDNDEGGCDIEEVGVPGVYAIPENTYQGYSLHSGAYVDKTINFTFNVETWDPPHNVNSNAVDFDSDGGC